MDTGKFRDSIVMADYLNPPLFHHFIRIVEIFSSAKSRKLDEETTSQKSSKNLCVAERY